MRNFTSLATSLQVIPQRVSAFFQSRLRLALLTLLVASSPALVSLILVQSQADVSNFIPKWNDEIDYWHQTLTFKEVGFQGGYYTIYELPPAAQFTHFYTYGPWYAALNGLIARLIGWDFTTILLINSVLVAVAVLIFCRTARLDGWQLVLLGLVLVTFWALLFYLFTAMQEAFQQSLAILIASVFYRALAKQEQVSFRFRVVGFLLIVIAGITRLSWVILFFPFLLLTGRKSYRHITLYVGVSIIAGLAVMLFSQYTGAPGNNSIFQVLSNFSVSIGYGFRYLWFYFATNIKLFLDLNKYPLDVIQTIEVLALLLGSFLVVILRRKQARWEAFFHLYNLGMIIFASLLLYIIATYGDYRVIATHLMITLLLLVALRRTRIVLLIVLFNLIMTPVFLDQYQIKIMPKFTPDHREYEAFRDATDGYLQYDSSTSNAWCKTLLFPVNLFETELLSIPADFGYSFYIDPDEPSLTFKSQYLLLDEQGYNAVTSRKDAPQLEYLVETPIGNLYRNLTAGCS